ncbi:MAG: hypothetical protein RIQ41_460 [Candidatus Parcubacteria bacterium]|jgi:16S rRNA (uracil1498-N3)-methyltransferase
MRLHRFYIHKPLGEELVVESAGEGNELIHQWAHVFRYTSGDEVILFSDVDADTQHDYVYTITLISQQEVRLAPSRTIPQASTLPITLVMALVKKDTFETIVRQATELGVERIIPVQASRSEKKNLNFERIFAISREAAEQCGRGTLPVIDDVRRVEDALTLLACTSIVGSLHGTQGVLDELPSQPCALWVGPEGGWTDEEEVLFREHNFIFLRCADTVLKADTAATALLATLATRFPLQKTQ